MKAYELVPETGILRMGERPSPDVGPLDVKIRVRAVSLNFRDLAVRKSAKKLRRATVPTSDGAGEVVAIGAQVKSLAVGDRVCGAFFPEWNDGAFDAQHLAGALGGTRDGMLAEEIVLPASGTVKMPPGMTFEAAATLPCAGVTAWNALFVAASLKPGDKLLVQGSGGVSIFALQLARAVHAHVYATSSTPEKRERLASMGTRETFDYREAGWGKQVREATGGVDLAIEVGGAGNFDQTIAALRYGGTMVLIGTLAGTAGSVDTYQVFHKGIRVQGIEVGSVRSFRDFMSAIEATKIEPIIDRVFPFDEASAAYDYLASGAHFGKVVVRVG
jgi:NADPH:quinone reductase-like Zn-dependent oxidoreductase